MESFLTFYPGKELRAALDQRELEACVVQWDGTRRHGTTPNFAPERRVLRQVPVAYKGCLSAGPNTPQLTPQVTRAAPC